MTQEFENETPELDPNETSLFEAEEEAPAEALAEETAAALAEEESWTKDKALDEVKKRQAAEAENRELRDRLARLEGAVQARTKPAEEPKIPGLDYGDLENSLIPYIKHVVQPMLQRPDVEERFQTRVQADEIVAQQLYPDYMETIQVFKQYMNDPTIAKHYRAAGNPAQYAYHVAKQIQKTQTSPDAKTLRKENEELKAQLAAGGKPPPKQRPSNAAGGGRAAKPGKQEPTGSILDVLDQ